MKTTTNTAAATVSDLRDEYANALKGLIYDNSTLTVVRAEVERVIAASDIADEDIAAAYVAAIKNMRVACRRCLGSGQFTTGTNNGAPTGPGGDCFRCGGAGTQGHTDGHRNRTHDAHYMGRVA